MFQNVLIGIDGQRGGRDAIAVARRLACDDARVTLVNVYGAGLMPGRGAALLLASERQESQRLLEFERSRSWPGAELESCPDRSIGRALRERSLSRGADLIVVGASTRGAMGRLFLGDDASSTLNGAPSAVAVAPAGYGDSPHSLRRIGVGYDHSAESEQGLVIARELRDRYGAMVSALSVISLPHGEPIPHDWPSVATRLVESQRDRLSALADIETSATYGDPAEELERLSHNLDLLIVGSRNQGPRGRLFNGSTSNYLARRAACPLLVLPRSAVPAGQAASAEGVAAGT